jgi:hypothetical protein
MDFTKEVKEFLSGAKFSNGAYISIKQDNKISDRISYLVSLARNSSVIHLGFADHIPLIDEKIKKGIWLHKCLTDVARECIGVDIDSEAVDVLTNKLNIKDLYQHDVINDAPLPRITNGKWDYFIIGEVLEHIDNPVLFLSEIRKKYGSYVKRFVITVPNAWDYDNLKNLLNSVECINTDHRYWFTPFTLSKVCVRAGFNIEQCNFVSGSMPGRKRGFIYKRFPFLQSGVVAVITP